MKNETKQRIMQRRQKKRLWWVTIKWNEPLPFVGNFIIILSPKMCLDKKEQELNKVSKLITKPERQRQSEWEGERERVVKSGTKRKKSKRKLFEADSGWNSCWASHHCLGFFLYARFTRSPIHSFGGSADESFKWPTGRHHKSKIEYEY